MRVYTSLFLIFDSDPVRLNLHVHTHITITFFNGQQGCYTRMSCVCVCRCVCRCSDLSEDTEGCVAELRLADSVQSTLNDGHHSMHVETRHDPWELERIQPAFVGNESCDADSTKVQTFGAISESINETRRSLHRSYSMGYGPTRCIPVISRRLAASAGKPDCTYTFPRCAGQLV